MHMKKFNTDPLDMLNKWYCDHMLCGLQGKPDTRVFFLKKAFSAYKIKYNLPTFDV